MNPPAFVHCRWCGKKVVRQALRAHQLRRCAVRALREHVHAVARSLGLERQGPGELERILEHLSEPPAWRANAAGWERLIEDGGRRKLAVREE